MVITSEIFIVSLLLLHDVFETIAPLNLLLQIGNEQLCLTDVKTYVLHLTRSKLENLRAGETNWFKEENFDDMVHKVQQQMLSLPPIARLQLLIQVLDGNVTCYGMISNTATLGKRFIPTIFTCFTCF